MFFSASHQQTEISDVPIVKARLSKLSLWSFRNYDYERLEFHAPFVIFYGANGAGKTNILEAISYLAPGKGLRRAPLGQIIQANHGGHDDRLQPWAVSVSVCHDGEDVALISSGLDPQCLYEGFEKRVGRIEGEPIPNLTTFEDYVSFLWLTPEMDRLFKESPGVRRKFLDKLILRFEPKLAPHWHAYDQAMRSRMALLKRRQMDALWLDQLERQMVEAAMVMLHAREHWIDMLCQVSMEHLQTFPRVEFHLQGALESKCVGESYANVEDFFAEQLKARRSRDAEQGATSLGPHLTNFQALYTPKGLYAAQCSTGEVKLLLLALILSAARLEMWQRGRTPVMLLDEVMVHLDAQRRATLTEELHRLQVQTFVTGTDLDVFSAMCSRAAKFCVKEGKIENT